MKIVSQNLLARTIKSNIAELSVNIVQTIFYTHTEEQVIWKLCVL